MSFEVSTFKLLLNDFIRPHQHVRRNRQADLLRGFEIDDELKLFRLLYGKIGGFGALKDLVHKNGGASVGFDPVCSVGHEATKFHKIFPTSYRRQAIFYRLAYDLFLITSDQPPSCHEESATPRLD